MGMLVMLSRLISLIWLPNHASHCEFFYLEEVEDPEITVQQSRPWNNATDWPLYNKAKEEYYVSQQRYQHDKQALCPIYVLFTHPYRL
jgi:hypothetical protein